MGISVWLVLAVILLCSGVQSRPPACPSPCLCTPGPTLNCSTAGLSLAPPLLPASLSSLDLSYNLLTSLRQRWAQPSLRRLWLGHNNLTHLSLCVGGPRPPHRGPPGGRGGCESWAPALEMLSAERNLLEGLPRGLKGLRGLQVLHLPNNRISSVGEEDLGHLPHLRELLLQNNLISSLHPQALRHLPQLRVLDLSFNLLTTLSPTTHLWLGALGGGASLRGNKWRCNCALRSLQRRMTHDRDLGRRNWGGVVCTWPPSLSGRELLQLEEAELSCSRGGASEGRHQEVKVEEGTELLLPCDSSQQGSQWQTPRGVVSGGVSGLLIHDITAQDSGLYVCVSGPEGALSVYDVQVHLTREPGPRARTRSSRSLNRAGQELSPQSGGPQGGVKSLESPTKSDLTLAICLSVFITFLVAFILGVLARPLLDKLCRRLRPKRSPPSSPAVDARRPYDNGAYSDEEEEQEGGLERRVTFTRPAGGQSDPGTVQYYDTLAGSEQNDQVYDTVKEEAIYSNTLQWEASPGTPEGGRPRGRNNSERESDGRDGEQPPRGHTMEFEPIPDLDPGVERRRLSESSSHSSHSSHSSDVPGRRGQVTQNNPWEPSSPPQTDIPLQQRAASPVVTQAPTLPSPVAGSEVPGFSSEPFADWKPKMAIGEDPEEYNDSGESFEFSDSFRGASGRFTDLGFPGRGSVREHSDSSVCSESETTEYTVNVEREEVEVKDEAVKDAQLAHGTLPQPDLHPRPGADQERFRDKEVESSGSSQSSNSDGEDTQYTVNREEDEDEEEEVNPVPHPDPVARWAGLGLKGRLDIKVSQENTLDTPKTPPTASSSSDSEEETSEQINRQTKVPDNRDSSFSVGGVPVSFAPRRALNIHLDNSTSSRDEQAWRSTSTKHQEQEIKPASPPETPRTPPPASSSSDSEDETREQTKVPVNRDSSFSVGGVPVSFAPRRALNIHLDNSSQSSTDQSAWKSSSTKYQDDQIRAASPLSFDKTVPSLSSETEDETIEQTKVSDNHDSSFSVGGVPVSFAPRRALNIHLDSSSQLNADQNAWRSTSTKYQEQEIKPAPPPEIPRTPPPASSSSDSEDETREPTTGCDSPFSVGGVKVSFAPRRALNVHLDNSAQLSTDQNTWRSNSTKYQVEDSSSQIWGRLDTKPPHESPPASSSDSEEETSEHINRQTKVPVNRDSSFSVGGVPVSFAPRRALNIHLDNSSQLSTDQNTWRSTSTKYQDHQIRTASPLSFDKTVPSSSSESEDETIEQTKVSDNHDSSFSVGGVPVSFAPRRALNIHLDNSSSNKDEYAWRSTSTKYQEQEIKPAPPPEIPRTPPPASSSSDSEDETREQTKVPDNRDSSFSVGGVPVSFAPRRALNIHLDNSSNLRTDEIGWRPTSTRYQEEDTKLSSPPAIPRTPPPASSSSDSEDETSEQINRQTKYDEDSPFSVGGVKVSFAPKRAFNIHLDSSTQLSTEEKACRPTSTKYQGEERSSSQTWRRLDIQVPQESPPETPRTPPPASSSSDSEDETREQTKVSDNHDSSFSVGGAPVSFAPRRALNIHLDNSSQLTDENTWRPTSTKYREEDIQPASRLSSYKNSTSSSSFAYETRSEESPLSVGSVAVFLAPRRALNIHVDSSSSSTDDPGWMASPEDRVGRERLSGTETQRWETEKTSSLRTTFQDPPPSLQTTSTSGLEPRTNMSGTGLRMPRLRRRLVVDIQAPQEAAPGTVPPGGEEGDDGQDWRSSGQQGGEVAGLSPLGSPSWGAGGGTGSLGLLGYATPYHSARPYHSVTLETVTPTSPRGDQQQTDV